jgi:hypothetical protein
MVTLWDIVSEVVGLILYRSSSDAVSDRKELKIKGQQQA